MVKLAGNVKMLDLMAEETMFLEELGRERKEGDVGIAVYVVRNSEAFFVEDFALPTAMNKRFEKESPESLYRGGIVGIMKYQGKFLAVPDERSQWFKPLPAGIVKFTEGADLAKAARRELMEEVFISSLGNVKGAHKQDRAVRYVPKGIGDVALHNAALNVMAQGFEEIGKLDVIEYVLNQTNKAFECVFGWELPDDLAGFTVSLNEDWFQGGNSGIPVFALNPDGTLYGVFSGQQGLQPISRYRIHETLERYLQK